MIRFAITGKNSAVLLGTDNALLTLPPAGALQALTLFPSKDLIHATPDGRITARLSTVNAETGDADAVGMRAIRDWRAAEHVPVFDPLTATVGHPRRDGSLTRTVTPEEWANVSGWFNGVLKEVIYSRSQNGLRWRGFWNSAPWLALTALEEAVSVNPLLFPLAFQGGTLRPVYDRRAVLRALVEETRLNLSRRGLRAHPEQAKARLGKWLCLLRIETGEGSRLLLSDDLTLQNGRPVGARVRSEWGGPRLVGLTQRAREGISPSGLLFEAQTLLTQHQMREVVGVDGARVQHLCFFESQSREFLAVSDDAAVATARALLTPDFDEENAVWHAQELGPETFWERDHGPLAFQAVARPLVLANARLRSLIGQPGEGEVLLALSDLNVKRPARA